MSRYSNLRRGLDMEGAMYKAVVDDRPEKLRALLENGGDPNMFFGDTSRINAKSILHVCCEKGRLKCVETLLQYGVDPSKAASFGQTPLMICIMMEYLEIAEIIIHNEPEVLNDQDTQGRTPLHIAINNNCLEAVQLLLKFGAQTDIITSNGITPMMALCALKEFDEAGTFLRALIDAGATCDIQDFKSRQTALQFAVISKNPETVSILLENGANPNTIDSGGRTPLTTLMLEHLKGYATTKVVDPDVMTIVSMLVEAGSDLNMNSHEYTNVLSVATSMKCVPLVQYFLECGASQIGKFFSNITPLLIAASRKDVETAKVLLNWRCDLYLKGRVMRRNYEFFRDPFELSVEEGCLELAVLLAEKGYNLSRIEYLTNWELRPPLPLRLAPDILDILRLNAVLPPSLFRCAVTCIRQALGDDISTRVNYLPLPKCLLGNLE